MSEKLLEWRLFGTRYGAGRGRRRSSRTSSWAVYEKSLCQSPTA
jgi:hypothetical protein